MDNTYDIIVVGAGPIGLLLANLLGKRGIKTLVLEKKEKPDRLSKAIGITPPSLMILKTLGLDTVFMEHGVKVEDVVIHGTKGVIGSTSFKKLPSDYPFILSIPQSQTESLLQENLSHYPSITVKREREVTALSRRDTEIVISARNIVQNSDETYAAKFVCGCDGAKSTLRTLMNITFKGGRYRDTFLMGDFIDHSGFNTEAHLFFTRHGAVESFPLPGGLRRWIVQTPYYMKEPPQNYLVQQVKKRARMDISTSKNISTSPFGVQHYLAATYYRDRVIFCGDSAHVMSPIGGQGMNTGFADAEFALMLIEKFIADKVVPEHYSDKYELYRKRAAKAAIKRAALSMRIGTMKGTIVSAIRNGLIYILLRILCKYIPPHFSMLTIPFGSLAGVKTTDPLFFNHQELHQAE